MKKLNSSNCLLLIMSAIATFTGIQHSAVHAGFGLVFPSHHQKSCCVCPHCQHVCKLEAKQVDEELTCYDVESKVICIPKVVFPWQKNACKPCVNNGGRTRSVCVLKAEKYKCPKCEYHWTAEKPSCEPCADDQQVMIGGDGLQSPEHVPSVTPQEHPVVELVEEPLMIESTPIEPMTAPMADPTPSQAAPLVPIDQPAPAAQPAPALEPLPDYITPISVSRPLPAKREITPRTPREPFSYGDVDESRNLPVQVDYSKLFQ